MKISSQKFRNGLKNDDVAAVVERALSKNSKAAFPLWWVSEENGCGPFFLSVLQFQTTSAQFPLELLRRLWSLVCIFFLLLLFHLSILYFDRLTVLSHGKSALIGPCRNIIWPTEEKWIWPYHIHVGNAKSINTFRLSRHSKAGILIYTWYYYPHMGSNRFASSDISGKFTIIEDFFVILTISEGDKRMCLSNIPLQRFLLHRFDCLSEPLQAPGLEQVLVRMAVPPPHDFEQGWYLLHVPHLPGLESRKTTKNRLVTICMSWKLWWNIF